jgi:glycosyltransferase involved in cell wall biosynthesis
VNRTLPLISVITPCHNGARHLAAMLASVRRQTFTEWEHIVVDDGSTDETAAIVEQHAASESRLRLVRQVHSGVAPARNAGYAASSTSSRYVYFLDADDLLEPDMLSVMVSYLDVHPSVGLAYCDFTAIDGEGKNVSAWRGTRYVPTRFGVRELGPEEAPTPLESVYSWAPVMESLSVLRRTVYQQTDGWDGTIGQHGEGVDLFVQIAMRSEVHFVNRALYKYRQHPQQASRGGADWRAQQDRRVQRKWRDRRLDPDARAAIDNAQRFRRRLQLCLALRAAQRYVAHGRPRQALSCYAAAARTAADILAGRSPWPAEQDEHVS